MRVWRVLCAGIAVASVGCSGAPSDPSTSSDVGDGPTTTQGAGQTFTRTIVTLNSDGTKSVVSHVVSYAAQLEHQRLLLNRIEAKRNGTLSVEDTLTNYGSDSGCTMNNNIADLFDQTFFFGNEICFINNGTSAEWAYLPNYARGTSTWDGLHIISWATGDEWAAVNNSDIERGTYCDDLKNNDNNPQQNGYGGCYILNGHKYCHYMDDFWMQPVGTDSFCN